MSANNDEIDLARSARYAEIRHELSNARQNDEQTQRAVLTSPQPTEVEKLIVALEWARRILGNMALEHTTGWRAIFARWPIHHEPLRSDARHVLPVIDKALASYGQLRAAAVEAFADDDEAADLFQSERISEAQVAYDQLMEDAEEGEPEPEVRAFEAMKAAIARADQIAATGRVR